MPHQTLFNKLLIFVNLYQLIKNKAASSISSGEILDLKVLQSDWLRAFWSICLEHFSQIEDLYKNTVNTINFNSEQVLGKLMTQFLFKFKRTYFRPIFCPFPLFFGAKNVCQKILHAQRFSSTMPKFRETLRSNSKKTTQQTAISEHCDQTGHTHI